MQGVMQTQLLRASVLVTCLLQTVFAICRPEYHLINGVCLKVVITHSLASEGSVVTWDQARSQCQSEDPVADLATLDPHGRLEGLTKYLTNSFPRETAAGYVYWVGGHGSDLSWRWVDNSKLSLNSLSWMPDNPPRGERGVTKIVPAGNENKRYYLTYNTLTDVAPGYVCQHNP